MPDMYRYEMVTTGWLVDVSSPCLNRELLTPLDDIDGNLRFRDQPEPLRPSSR